MVYLFSVQRIKGHGYSCAAVGGQPHVGIGLFIIIIIYYWVDIFFLLFTVFNYAKIKLTRMIERQYVKTMNINKRKETRIR